MELRHKKGNTYKRRKGEKKIWKFSPQKKTGHNTGPTQQSYYCGSGWLKEWNNKKDMAKGIRKGKDKKKHLRKKGGHNRGPTDQSYY